MSENVFYESGSRLLFFLFVRVFRRGSKGGRGNGIIIELNRLFYIGVCY